MMKPFIKKIIQGSQIRPPYFCIETFHRNFSGAINIDWTAVGSKFEAIFYRNDIEHIALFNKDGYLEEYKMYLPESMLPIAIKTHLDNKREIMNIVLINKGNTIVYEIIGRDKSLNRYLILFNDLGQQIEEKLL